jgi:hypothetical protein
LGLADFAELFLKRKLSLPVSRMWQRWVRRSSSAVVIFGSPKTVVRIAEDGGPFAEAEVRRDDDAGALAELAEQKFFLLEPNLGALHIKGHRIPNSVQWLASDVP